MGRKLEGLIFLSGLMVGGFGNYFINDKNKISNDYERKNKLTGTLKLKINEVPYMSIGKIEAFDDEGKCYEVFYNSIEGVVRIKESSAMAGNRIGKEIDF